jgi:hypothetical protein
MSGVTSKERGSARSKPCPPAVHFNHEKKGTQLMIVLGADMHKSSHTITGVAAATGEMLGDKTSSVGARGFDQVLRWARALGVDRVWALEDCRHVSGSFERFLIARGERVVRVPTRLMSGGRQPRRPLIRESGSARCRSRRRAESQRQILRIEPSIRSSVSDTGLTEMGRNLCARNNRGDAIRRLPPAAGGIRGRVPTDTERKGSETCPRRTST